LGEFRAFKNSGECDDFAFCWKIVKDRNYLTDHYESFCGDYDEKKLEAKLKADLEWANYPKPVYLR